MKAYRKKHTTLVLIAFIIATSYSLILFSRPIFDNSPTSEQAPSEQPQKLLAFDGKSAMHFAQAQCDIGPRPTGTAEGWKTGDYIISNLKSAGWMTIETQEFTFQNKPIRNIIGKRGQGALIIIGAHYDTRPFADLDRNDPKNRTQPIIGANDGASGVAVLLELARILPREPSKEIWLVFFDAEDLGGIDGWPFSVGAERMAASLKTKPQAVIVLDMIGDRDQQIYYEANSNMALQQSVFAEAGRLGYSANFIPEIRHSITDDHTPFLARGYPAIDLIDFDYPYWHTLDDTCDKIDAISLERVGSTVLAWLKTVGAFN